MVYAKVRVAKLAKVFKGTSGTSGAGVWEGEAAACASITTDCIPGPRVQKDIEDAKICAARPDFERFCHLLKPAVNSGT